MKFKKENASIYVLLSALAAAGGVSTFVRVFPYKNALIGALSLLLLAIGCAMQTYLFRKFKEKAHPLRDALLGLAVFFALAAGAAYFANRAAQLTGNGTLAVLIPAAAFALSFLVGAAAALFAGTKSVPSRVLVTVLCAAVLTASVLSAAQPLLRPGSSAETETSAESETAPQP